uniref:Putative lipocalin-3 1 n=1 Tax=Amblyomma parvum TaxID=251391 RepID=A0A023FVX6_AMBPA
MAPKQSVKAIALALLATIIQSNAEEASSPQLVQPDIVKFYSNDSVIWSYSLNTDGHNPCKVDFGINSNPPNISFERYSLDWHSRTPPTIFKGKTFSVNGEFKHTRSEPSSGLYDAMKIEYSDATAERRARTETRGSRFLEALLFESGSENCGVFEVRPLQNADKAVGSRQGRHGRTGARTTQTLDLRIKSYVEDIVKANKCLQEFKKSEKYAKIASSGRLAESIISHEQCKNGCSQNPHCAQSLPVEF